MRLRDSERGVVAVLVIFVVLVIVALFMFGGEEGVYEHQV